MQFLHPPGAHTNGSGFVYHAAQQGVAAKCVLYADPILLY